MTVFKTSSSTIISTKGSHCYYGRGCGSSSSTMLRARALLFLVSNMFFLLGSNPLISGNLRLESRLEAVFTYLYERQFIRPGVCVKHKTER
jgi:hypothetical protein